MSTEATAWALRQQVGHPTRKLILFLLADNVNGEGGWSDWHRPRWPRRCEVSRETVAKHLEVLQEMGLYQQGGRPKDHSDDVLGSTVSRPVRRG